jgi:cation transport ATPase
MRIVLDHSVQMTAFEYIPGQGVTCTIAGEEIVIGRRSLLESRGVPIGRCSSVCV